MRSSVGAPAVAAGRVARGTDSAVGGAVPHGVASTAALGRAGSGGDGRGAGAGTGATGAADSGTGAVGAAVRGGAGVAPHGAKSDKLH